MNWRAPSTMQRRWIGVTFAFWVVVFQGPAFVGTFTLEPWKSRWGFPDFFQEWSSARNYLKGRPIYGDLSASVEHYLPGVFDTSRGIPITVNAHPPTTVLAALPFSLFPFPVAFLVWNVVMLLPLAASIRLAARELDQPLSIWSVAWIIALAVLCSPLREQIRLGQLNLLLLILITAAWAADRRGRPVSTGVLLGVATTIKLFPAFLLFYHAARRQWTVFMSGVVASVATTAATAAILGTRVYRDYITLCVPKIQWFRVAWPNCSLWGFCSRLFYPAPVPVRNFWLTHPLCYSPTLARAAYAISGVVLVGTTVWAARRAGSTRQRDLSFAVAVTSMLLLSPIIWDHYLLLLLPPLAVLWFGEELSPTPRALLALVVCAVFFSPDVAWKLTGILRHVAAPWENLTIISFQFYALVALVVFPCREIALHARSGENAISNPSGSPPSTKCA